MQSFYVYRYVDEKTKEIVYIGKTSQLFVTDRLDQHKTDNVGIWASTTPHYIEFVELPREEDMTYLESYLIRKIKPRLNIVLFAHVAPPFEVVLDECKWINLSTYLQEKEKAKTIQADVFANQIALVKESNEIFDRTINGIVDSINRKDKNFIKKICFMSDLSIGKVYANKKDVQKTYEEENVEDVCKRFVSYTTASRIAGTVGDIKNVGIFDKYEIESDNVVFYTNQYIKKVLEVI